MVKATIVNYYDAPPEYVRDWLLDYQEDDTAKYFGDETPRKVTHEGDEIHLTQETPMGLSQAVVARRTERSWGGTNTWTKKGKVVMTGTLAEQVEPAGEGTKHTVELGLSPRTLPLKLMSPVMGPKVKKDVTAAFARIKRDLEADFKAGRPPAAKPT